MKCPYCNKNQLIYYESKMTNMCKVCRERRIPKHIPEKQHIEFLRLRKLKNGKYKKEKSS